MTTEPKKRVRKRKGKKTGPKAQLSTKQVEEIFDLILKNHEARNRAHFLTHCTAGNWLVEVATVAAQWNTLEFHVLVLFPGSHIFDPSRSVVLRVYTQVEAYIRALRRFGPEDPPPPLDDLELKRLSPRGRDRAKTRARSAA